MHPSPSIITHNQSSLEKSNIHPSSKMDFGFKNK